MKTTVSVPGNLLLTGEYLVTISGGKGVAVAIEPRALACAEPARDWSFEAIMGKDSLHWTSGSLPDLPLARGILDSAAELLPLSGGILPRGLAMRIDTSAFFNAEGGKTGLGSSAASAVAMALLICRHAGMNPDRVVPSALAIALKGHRAMQGGRGSGYDIYTSMHGGLGIFTGGEQPTWKSLPVEWLPPASIVFGQKSVSSSHAVAAFSRMRLEKPEEINPLLRALAEPSDAIEALCIDAPGNSIHVGFTSALIRSRDSGIRLGSLIGISALMENVPHDHFIKALGAGNEIGIAIPPLSGKSENVDYAPLVPAGGPLWC